MYIPIGNICPKKEKGMKEVMEMIGLMLSLALALVIFLTAVRGQELLFELMRIRFFGLTLFCIAVLCGLVSMINHK